MKSAFPTYLRSELKVPDPVRMPAMLNTNQSGFTRSPGWPSIFVSLSCGTHAGKRSQHREFPLSSQSQGKLLAMVS